jgi:hypothetical protein
MRTRHIGLVAVALLVTAGSVLAQNDTPSGDRPERGGGRGGFGRMGGDRNSYLGLLGIKEVRDELKVTEEQDKQVEGIREEIRNLPSPEGVPDFASLRDLSDDERRAAFAKMRAAGAAREKEARTKLATVLDEAQIKRLKGLWVQRVGSLTALNDSELATELKLTDDQKKLLTTQREEQQSQFGGRFGRGEGGGDFRERFEAARKAANEKADGVLTDEQKTAFAALKGDEFKFPPPQFGGGRGRDRGEGGERPNSGPQREAQ